MEFFSKHVYGSISKDGGFIWRWLLRKLPNLHFANPVHILRLQYTPCSLTLVHNLPPFRCNLLHVGAAGLDEGHVSGGIVVPVIDCPPRLLPAPHHLIILLVVHFMKAGMMTAAVAVEGGGSFEWMHHETEARACAHKRDFLRT